jgi:cytochrome d ubiquinol oxidase subunit I
VSLFHRSAKLAIWVLLIASVLQFRVGGQLGQVMTTVQPAKVASMEAQWETCQPCSFSAFQIGGWTPDDPPTKIIQIPYLLSILATGNPQGEVQGINEVQAQESAANPQNGDVQYYPNVFVQYWSMRVMAYTAGLSALVGLWGVFLLWRRRLDRAHVFQRLATWAVVLPFAMGTAGWVLTENGRQPWIVQGLMLTKDGLSTSVSATEVAISIVVFFLLYSILGIIGLILMLRLIRSGPEADESESDDADDRVPTLAY